MHSSPFVLTNAFIFQVVQLFQRTVLSLASPAAFWYRVMDQSLKCWLSITATVVSSCSSQLVLGLLFINFCDVPIQCVLNRSSESSAWDTGSQLSGVLHSRRGKWQALRSADSESIPCLPALPSLTPPPSAKPEPPGSELLRSYRAGGAVPRPSSGTLPLKWGFLHPSDQCGDSVCFVLKKKNKQTVKFLISSRLSAIFCPHWFKMILWWSF